VSIANFLDCGIVGVRKWWCGVVCVASCDVSRGEVGCGGGDRGGSWNRDEKIVVGDDEGVRRGGEIRFDFMCDFAALL
jgi:hypothetical protein